jgi:hypothetical protein
VQILRELTKEYAEIAVKPVQDERRDLWRRHNSLERTRPLVYAREFISATELIDPLLVCEEPVFRKQERLLRYWIQHDSFDDDYIIEPWLTLAATHRQDRFNLWGVPVERIPSPEPRGAWMFDPPIKRPEDTSRLQKPHHQIDEDATARDLNRLQEAVGDILPIHVNRSPMYQPNLAQELADLRGLEQVMWDMVDNPEWLHGLARFVADGVKTTFEEAEADGDWHPADGSNQAMTYSQELPDPQADGGAVKLDSLWCFFNAQEFTLVSPAMHDEFILRYQLPLMSRFGLISYGCCEDLSEKIDMLRKVPNLRRIAITPFADVRRCAEQIGEDYVMGWRPSPAEMVANAFDPDRIRKVVGEAVEAMRGCHFDICLKDVVTVRGEPQRIRDWVRITREVVEERC